MKRVAIAVVLAVVLAGLALTACSGSQEVSFPDPVIDEATGVLTPGVETPAETPEPAPTAEPSRGEAELPEPPAAGAPGGADPRIGQRNEVGDLLHIPTPQNNAAVKRGWESADPRVSQDDLVQRDRLEPGAVAPAGWEISPTGDGTGELTSLPVIEIGPGESAEVVPGQLLTWSDGGVITVGDYRVTGDAVIHGTGYYDRFTQTFDADEWAPLQLMAIRPGRAVIQVNGQQAVVNVVPARPWNGR